MTTQGNHWLQLALFLIRLRSKIMPYFIFLAMNSSKIQSARTGQCKKWIYTAPAYAFGCSITWVFPWFNCSRASEKWNTAMSSTRMQFVTSKKLLFESCEIKRSKNSVPHNPAASIASDELNQPALCGAEVIAGGSQQARSQHSAGERSSFVSLL